MNKDAEMVNKLKEVYLEMIDKVKNIYLERNIEYGDSWRELEIRGVYAQLHSKFFRLKNKIENKQESKADLTDTLVDIVNYSIIASFFLYKDKWKGRSSEIELYHCIFDKIVEEYKSIYRTLDIERSGVEQYYGLIEKQHHILKEKIWDNAQVDDKIESDEKFRDGIAFVLCILGSISLIWLTFINIGRGEI